MNQDENVLLRTSVSNSDEDSMSSSSLVNIYEDAIFSLCDTKQEDDPKPSTSFDSYKQSIASGSVDNLDLLSLLDVKIETVSRPTTSNVNLDEVSNKSSDFEPDEVPVLRITQEEENIIDVEEPPAPVKKRGRRNKNTVTVGLKPTRVSKRVKKRPTLMNYNSFGCRVKCHWTDAEKINLLKGLEEFGPDNIEALKTLLPKKREEDIQNYIRTWKDLARLDLEKKIFREKKKSDSATLNCISKLDEWIKHLRQSGEISPARLFALSNVFILIAEYGEFPDPSECGGIDLRSMYRYLHSMVNGTPYHGVNKPTAKVLDESISYLFKTICDQKLLSKLQYHLYNCDIADPPVPQPNIRTYSRPKAVKSRKFEDMIKQPDINPLKLPFEAISRRLGRVNTTFVKDFDLTSESDDDDK